MLRRGSTKDIHGALKPLGVVCGNPQGLASIRELIQDEVLGPSRQQMSYKLMRRPLHQAHLIKRDIASWLTSATLLLHPHRGSQYYALAQI